MNPMVMAGLAGAFIFQLILLTIVGWQNRDVLSHTDGIFYMRIASYYASGNLDLAINGYWGPLYSWLIAPLLGFVEKPLYAARIVMGLSAVVFLFGCVSIFRNLELHPWGIIAGAWLAALASVAWSVESNNPDLLMSGLVCLAISRMLSRQWLTNQPPQVAAGMLWGIAYFAKAVAFPLAIITSSVIAWLWGIGRTVDRKTILRSSAMTLFAFISVASVWILILSANYGGLVISTSGKINHAIVGPRDTERFHPHSSTFNVPEPGRISAGEDPTNMPYKYWSPFESSDYAKHQLSLIYSNAGAMIKHLVGFSFLGFGALATFGGLILLFLRRKNSSVERWRWSGVIVLCLAVIYLPVYALDQRYYFPAYAFLLAASLGMVAWLTPESQQGSKLNRLLGLGLVVLCFVIPAIAGVRRAFTMTENKLVSLRAYELAERLQAAGLQDSIAGGNTAGLYFAFCANQPWHGSGVKPTGEDFKKSKAKLIVVQRNQPVVEELDYDASFRNLDSLLFDNSEQASQCPLKVYQLILSIPNE